MIVTMAWQSFAGGIPGHGRRGLLISTEGVDARAGAG